MILLFADTRVIVAGSNSSLKSQGGVSAFTSDLISFLIRQNENLALIGNFKAEKTNFAQTYFFKSRSNSIFLIKLTLYFFLHRFSKSDVYYFQRPDHILTSCFRKGRKILHLHGNQRENIKSRKALPIQLIYNLIEYFGLKVAEVVVVTDKITASEYVRHYPFLANKLHIIPTGINLTDFQPNELKEAVASNNDKIISYIGRLEYPKRISEIIYAFSIATSKDPLLKLYIAGEGNQLNSLISKVEVLQIKDKVFFTGLLTKSEVYNLINKSLAGILLSYSEGSPVSVKEFLACGKPVIVNNVGDVADYIIDGKTGQIVDPELPENIANAILDITKNSDLLTENCLQIATQYDNNFLFETIYAHLLDKICPFENIN